MQLQVTLLALLVALSTLPAPCVSAAPTDPSATHASMRGFGEVEIRTRYYGGSADRSSMVTFAAEDPEHAVAIASKFKADLLGFGDLKALPGGVVTLVGVGSWRIGVEGSDCYVLFSRTRKELDALAAKLGASTWSAAPDRAYPRWLDCFDNAGTGIWWGGGGQKRTLPDDFQWVKDRGFTITDQPPTESEYIAPGVLDNTVPDWFGAMAARYDLPYRTLLWDSRPEWAWNRLPLPYVIPAGLTTTAARAFYAYYGAYYSFEPVPATDRYIADFRRRFHANLATDPNYIGSHGLTEVPDAGILELAAVAGEPNVKALWHSYLVNTLGKDLSGVSLLHKGSPDAYKNWDDVNVPSPEEFLRVNEHTVRLNGTWEGLPDHAKAGIAAKWYTDDGAPKSGWVAVASNDPMMLMYGGGYAPNQRDNVAAYWLRRKVTVSSAQLPFLKYLQVVRTKWGGGSQSTFCDAFVNGQPIAPSPAEQGGDIAYSFPLSGILHEGENTVTLCMYGCPPAGTIALGEMPLRRYPDMTPPENRLWYDGVNFDAWLRMQTLENNLKAMRAGDPNRPFKVMATINLLDLTQDICARYGAYEHDTGGAGGYWCPMTGARLSRTHGLPFSCEQGGPPNTVADMQKAMTFYLMYGDDAVDLVFSVSAYSDKPDVAAWVDKNLDLMHCIGKMTLPLPPIALLRSTRATRLGFSDPWNWDIGRGILQAVGRNFAYVEVPDIASGDISKYPIVIDDGTVLLTEDEVQGILRYVRAGGIFVAQFDTARNTPEQAETYPLAAALGLKVSPKLITAENYNNWPLGKIYFSQSETLMPSMRGKSAEGSGVAIDYTNSAHTGALSIEGSGRGIEPVATWQDGTMAVCDIHMGRGRLIYLGTPLYMRMKDDHGVWVNREAQQALLDEMLGGLGAPRDSWTGTRDLWAEHWVSKNGVYDLYPTARMEGSSPATLTATAALRRETPPQSVVEVSANGHPVVRATYKDGRVVLPPADYTPMQFRMYAAPRADVENAALNWIGVQAQHWRSLPPMSPLALPDVIETPEDTIAMPEGWRMSTTQSDDTWTKPDFDDSGWKASKLESFASLGLPEASTAQFRKAVVIPPTWKGRRVNLVFNALYTFGISDGRIWINGVPAAIRQPTAAYGETSFTLDVTDQAASGKIVLAVSTDGLQTVVKTPGSPAGVTGMFTLQAIETPLATTPLPGPWTAGSDFNILTPVKVGDRVNCVYMETHFTLPKEWPSPRVSLTSPEHLGFLVLNGTFVNTPAWMKSLDISGLVKRDGDNVLRWMPRDYSNLDYRNVSQRSAPTMALAWLPPR